MAVPSTGGRRPPAERLSAGRALRKQVSRSSHADWKPDRRDPIAILRQDDRGRLKELLPIRYGRMHASPLAFLRGVASMMAADLAPTPVTGLRVQACGDAHLLNFGGFDTPERRLDLERDGHPVLAGHGHTSRDHPAAKIFPQTAPDKRGRPRIVEVPKKIYHSHAVEAEAKAFLRGFRESLAPERRVLFDRFHEV